MTTIRYGIAWPAWPSRPAHVDVYPSEDAAISALANLDPLEPGRLARTALDGGWEATAGEKWEPVGPVTETVVQPLRPWGRYEIDRIAARYERGYLGMIGA